MGESYIRWAVERALGKWVGNKRYPPVMPKGVRLFRRKARYGELYDRGIMSIKSKGRTGAAVRARLMRNTHDILLDKWP